MVKNELEKSILKFVGLDCKGNSKIFTINNLSCYNLSIEKEVEKNMEETKNNKGLVWLIVILIVLVLGLVGYIVFDKVLAKEKTLNKNETTTTTSKVTLENEEEKDKVISIEINKNEEIDTSHYYYDNDSNQSLVYKIKSNNNEVEIVYNDGHTTFKMNGFEELKYNPDNYILHSVQKFNNYLFVRLSCACGIPSAWYTINMDKKEISETLCIPSNDGTCTGFTYKEIIDNNYYEYSYKMNYNSSKYEEEKTAEFSCKDYEVYNIAGMDIDIDENGNPLDSNYKKCEDETCERRTNMCFSFTA